MAENISYTLIDLVLIIKENNTIQRNSLHEILFLKLFKKNDDNYTILLIHT